MGVFTNRLPQSFLTESADGATQGVGPLALLSIHDISHEIYGSKEL